MKAGPYNGAKHNMSVEDFGFKPYEAPKSEGNRLFSSRPANFSAIFQGGAAPHRHEERANERGHQSFTQSAPRSKKTYGG